MSALWPMTIPGMPEKPNPARSQGHSWLTFAQRRPIWCQTLGRLAPRCGSLASSGIPDSVRSPETTHELEPMPSPTPPTSSDTASTTPPTRLHSSEAVCAEGEASVVVNDAGATVASGGGVIFGTMTGLRSYG